MYIYIYTTKKDHGIFEEPARSGTPELKIHQKSIKNNGKNKGKLRTNRGKKYKKNEKIEKNGVGPPFGASPAIFFNNF